MKKCCCIHGHNTMLFTEEVTSLCLSTRQERQAGLHDIIHFCIKNKVAVGVVSAKYLHIKVFFVLF